MSFTSVHTPDKLYYDVTITNLETTTAIPPIAYFNETRNVPFVYDPESYLMSIIRFTLDTPTLPVIIPEIVPFSSNVNLTIYDITLSYTTTLGHYYTFTQPIIFAPQDLQAEVPSPPSMTSNGLQNNSTGYYYIFNYQYFISLINTAFTACYNGLDTLVIAGGDALPSAYEPTMVFDSVGYTAQIYCDTAGYNTGSASPYIKIFFNPALFQLFSSFPFLIETLATPNAPQAVQLITDSFGGALLQSFPSLNTEYTAIVISQEYSTISLWTPVTSICFCSNTLPIVPNQISNPLLFVNGKVINNGGNNANISQIITDFVSDTGLYKPNIVYNPSAQYRYIELLGNRPIYNLDVTIYWKDRTGTLTPFRLSSGSTATLKFFFTKKSSVENYKSNH